LLMFSLFDCFCFLFSLVCLFYLILLLFSLFVCFTCFCCLVFSFCLFYLFLLFCLFVWLVAVVFFVRLFVCFTCFCCCFLCSFVCLYLSHVFTHHCCWWRAAKFRSCVPHLRPLSKKRGRGNPTEAAATWWMGIFCLTRRTAPIKSPLKPNRGYGRFIKGRIPIRLIVVIIIIVNIL
jgi:hypothetical protein